MMKKDLNRPIPSNHSVEGWKEVEIEENNEPLVPLNDFAPKHILVKSQYFEQNIKGALEICYCRKEVAQKLVEASKYLPNGYKLLIWDAWRPIEVQERLYKQIVSSLKIQNPNITQTEIEGFVSLPSNSLKKPSPHLTGGSVDLTIVNSKNIEIDMGTQFDCFNQVAQSDYFEWNSINNQAKQNRRLLYNILTKVGFVNLPTEWWHFDYGNQLWGHAKKQKAFYSNAKL